ncbi:MAG: hypothetical protein CSB55_06275 [Candidatus Cloacimonadota bacterium]|nr:MAG: hypothetical protein CSB55_06275 [Candidatus Cloacimonadota bacterium]
MKKKEIAVGGQAVIEGVMMRGPEHIATAVRRKNGSIDVCKEIFKSVTASNKFFGLPIIRGFVSLIEMMKIGIKSLTFSANRYEEDFKEENNSAKKKKKSSPFKEKTEEIMSFIFAFGLAFLFFMYLPYQIADFMNISKENVYFNAVAGSIRILFFVLYVWIISFMKDVRRVFEYHGAEHKSVYAYEKNDKLIPETVDAYSTLHPRCGTSFIFLVLLVSIFLFSVIDTLVAVFFNYTPVALIRVLYHLPFIPLVSGISYEILRFSGKNINNFAVRIFTAPGLALQRITTRKPDHKQLEVALVALKVALELDLSGHKNVNFIENKEK